MDITTQVILVIPRRGFQRWSKSVRSLFQLAEIPAGTVFNHSNNYEPLLIYALFPFHALAPCHDQKTVSNLQDDVHARAVVRHMLQRIPEDRTTVHLCALRRIIERVAKMPEDISSSMLQDHLAAAIATAGRWWWRRADASVGKCSESESDEAGNCTGHSR